MSDDLHLDVLAGGGKDEKIGKLKIVGRQVPRAVDAVVIKVPAGNQEGGSLVRSAKA